MAIHHHNSRPTRAISVWLIPFLLAGIAIFPAGCSKEEMKQKMQDLQTTAEAYTEKAVEAVEEKLPESGSISLQLTPPIDKIKSLDLHLVTIGDGRPNVIQIVSYDLASARTYPSVMLQGTTMTSSAAALAGETIQCDLYFQQTPNSPIAMTKPGESVSVSFGSLITDDNAMPAKLGASELIGADGKMIQVRGGDLVAVIRGDGELIQ